MKRKSVFVIETREEGDIGICGRSVKKELP